MFRSRFLLRCYFTTLLVKTSMLVKYFDDPNMKMTPNQSNLVQHMMYIWSFVTIISSWITLLPYFRTQQVPTCCLEQALCKPYFTSTLVVMSHERNTFSMSVFNQVIAQAWTHAKRDSEKTMLQRKHRTSIALRLCHYQRY